MTPNNLRMASPAIRKRDHGNERYQADFGRQNFALTLLQIDDDRYGPDDVDDGEQHDECAKYFLEIEFHLFFTAKCKVFCRDKYVLSPLIFQ